MTMPVVTRFATNHHLYMAGGISGGAVAPLLPTSLSYHVSKKSSKRSSRFFLGISDLAFECRHEHLRVACKSGASRVVLGTTFLHVCQAEGTVAHPRANGIGLMASGA